MAQQVLRLGLLIGQCRGSCCILLHKFRAHECGNVFKCKFYPRAVAECGHGPTPHLGRPVHCGSALGHKLCMVWGASSSSSSWASAASSLFGLWLTVLYLLRAADSLVDGARCCTVLCTRLVDVAAVGEVFVIVFLIAESVRLCLSRGFVIIISSIKTHTHT